MIMKDNLPRHFFRNRMHKIKETHRHIMTFITYVIIITYVRYNTKKGWTEMSYKFKCHIVNSRASKSRPIAIDRLDRACAEAAANHGDQRARFHIYASDRYIAWTFVSISRKSEEHAATVGNNALDCTRSIREARRTGDDIVVILVIS